MATRTRGVDHQRREALHPPIDRHVINIDATLGEQFFDIAVRQVVAQISAHRQQDDVRREPEPSKRRRSRTATTNHRSTLRPRPIRQRNSASDTDLKKIAQAA